jgi:heterodisulfide reductase subunit A
MRYTTEDGRTLAETFDMAVLSVGLEAPADSQALAEKFSIALDRPNFAKTDAFKPVSSSRAGVLVTGAFTEPKAIPRSVTEASATASEAARLLAAAKGSLTRSKIYPPEKTPTGVAPGWGSSSAPAASTSPVWWMSPPIPRSAKRPPTAGR